MDYDPSDKKLIKELDELLEARITMIIDVDRGLMVELRNKLIKLIEDRDEWRRSVFDTAQSFYD